MSEYFEELKKMIDPGKGYDMERIEKAYLLAEKAHSGQFRASGEPYIVHPVEAAKITVQLGMDTDTVVTALLHDVVEDTDITLEEIKKEFGTDVENLVDGVTKLKQIKKVNNASKEEQQAENVRKMFMAMAKDIRVIIVKLADRLHNMRTIDAKPVEKQRRIAHETMEIYAPLAHRLGIRPIMEELEDRCIRVLDPVGYHDIESRMEMQKDEQKEFLDHIKNKIDERLRKENCEFYLMGRIKSVYGIYRKIYEQGKSMEEIYDIYAVRVIVNTVYDCYYVLGVMHDLFRPIPDRFKDYISTPKQNMYQSLHTTCIDSKGIPFEIQIRTWDMHHTAEYGIAAHWKYKLGINGTVKFEERLAWIRQLLENQSDSEDVEDLVSTIKSDLVPEEVFVFTPKGDVFNLPMGATVIDFAYAIHSAVGNKMIGAKVDGRIVPLDYQVKTGEIVEVLTSSQPGKGPSRDWLNIVKTSQARAKIRQWYKKERRDENIAEGKAEVEKEFKRNFIRLAEPEYTEFIKKIAERQHCKSIEDFYAAIGYGGISLMHMMPKIKEDYVKMTKAEEPVINIAPVKKRTKSTEGVVVEGIDNCLIKFSRCCNPLPGDNIIGFITRGHGVSIHTRNCPNVPADISKAGEPDRWVVAYWDTNIREDFKCTLQISCLNRIGLFADVSSLLANMHIMINDISTRNTKDGRTSIMLTVSVNGVEHLNSLTAKLSKISGVLSVERTGV